MSISRHVKVRNDTKPNKATDCASCDKSFRYPSDLTRHLKSHENKGDMLVPSFVDMENTYGSEVPEVLSDTLHELPPSTAEEDSNQHPTNDATQNTVECPRKWKDILAHTAAAASVEEADIYQCLIQYFKSLLHSGKGQDKLNSLLYHMFGCDRLRDPAFLYFIATQLSTNYSNFKKSIETWFDGGMKSRQTSCF